MPALWLSVEVGGDPEAFKTASLGLALNNDIRFSNCNPIVAATEVLIKSPILKF